MWVTCPNCEEGFWFDPPKKKPKYKPYVPQGELAPYSELILSLHAKGTLRMQIAQAVLATLPHDASAAVKQRMYASITDMLMRMGRLFTGTADQQVHKRGEFIAAHRKRGATYEHLAQLMGVTRERVRQIDLRHQRRLKHLAKTPTVLDDSTIVDDFPWTVRTANCLKNDDIVTIGQLRRQTEAGLLRIPYFGLKSLQEVIGVLAKHGLSLGSE